MRALGALGLAVAAGWALSGLPVAVLAGEAWTSKPASAWTQEETLDLLTKSPWTAQVVLQHMTGRQLAKFADGTPFGMWVVYRSSPDLPPRIFDQQPLEIKQEFVDATYAVRWSSASAVQQALERLKALSPVVQEMQAAAPELPAENYALTARVVKPPSEDSMREMERKSRGVEDDRSGRPVYDEAPKVPDIFAGLAEEELKGRATLTTARKVQLKPARAVRHGLGASEGITFFFPRTVNGAATLPPGTVWAEFSFEGRRGDKLKARFKMKEMVFQGKQDY